jgi:hypothetical protein
MVGPNVNIVSGDGERRVAAALDNLVVTAAPPVIRADFDAMLGTGI